jgi:hypothetical protein
MSSSVTYNEIAEGIISNSIKKAIFIDDEAVKPFSPESMSNKFCSNLFNSFNDNNSVIDICPYSKELNTTDKILTGRNDLIILDWELSKVTPKYKDTLEIIKKIISNESPHFLCVYTNEEQSIFSDIIIKIKAYLNSFEQQLTGDFEVFNNFLDDCGLELDSFKEEFDESIRNYLLESQSDEKKSRKELIKGFRQFFSDDYDSFVADFADLNEFCFNYLGFTQQGQQESFYTNVYKENNCIVGNNTIILIVQKGEIEPNNFVSGFTKSILNIPHSYLTLVSLDYRNKFLQQSSFLGKELQKISENAFYHHIVELGAEFEDFMQELWKHDNTSFLNDFKSSILEQFESFKKENKIDELIAKDSEIYQDLAKLNSYYNTTPKVFNKGKLLFGDIFLINNNADKVLLCITAHCDCLRPKKVNNNFFFIEGDIINLKEKHIKESDSGFKSFIVQDNTPKVIDWGDCKPFTLHIPADMNDKSKLIKVLMNNEEQEIQYFNSLKENYTQRISNNSFGYASRVGISFAKIGE